MVEMTTVRLTGRLVALFLSLTLPATLLAGALDDYYLTRFGEGGSRGSSGALSQATEVAAPLERCGTPLRRGLGRDWRLLSTTTRKSLAKYLALPVLSGTEQTVDSLSGRFRIHYATSGADAATAAWAQTTARIFDDVYGVEVLKMGYRSPPAASTGAPYDVYLQDRASAGEYGYTQEIGPASSGSVSYSAYTVVDRSFSSSIYAPYTPMESLQVTAAHEFHHSIQFGYNCFFDIWYAEATATWMEDELYDGVNQLYDYLTPSVANSTLSLDTAVSTDTGGGYGRWLFNRYLTEQYGAPVVRKIWEELSLIPAPAGGGDIPMVPVLNSVLAREYSSGLSTDYFGFVTRLYSRDWTTHTNEIDPPTIFIPSYLPLATYGAFPVTSLSSPSPAVVLPHYSYAYFRLPTTPSGVTMAISRAPGMEVTAFRALTGSGLPADSYQPIQSDGRTTIVIPADSGTGEIVLLLCNPTAGDGLYASFTSDVAISPPPARIGLKSYPDLQSAYDSALPDDLIMLKEGVQVGSLHATADKRVTIRGGYSPSYTALAGGTIIQGTLTLVQGSVILDELVVR